ncbi:MAG: DUF92 domain-containing protein [Gemmatimonadales bacterium]
MPLPLAAAISAVVAWLGWRAQTLTLSGGVAAWTVGTLILYGSGWNGGAVLAAFFVSSNLISRLGPRAASQLDAKSDRRDLWQVYANGGAAAAGALAGRTDPALGIWLATASLAAAAADTWATSVGTRSGMAPRLLGFGAVVPPGTNGGMTLAGTAAAVAGALIVAGTGAATTGMPLLLASGTLIGFAGMIVDSMIGAWFQGGFTCPACNQDSERRVHRCGAATVRTKGVTWLNNDGVNFLVTVLAACMALLWWRWLD